MSNSKNINGLFGRDGGLRGFLMAALFAALTAVGAYIRIPVGYSTFTLQTFFTAMAGILLGPYWGAASQLIYLLLGLAGVPVFSEGGGLMYLARPTFGFLIGMVLMAFVTGHLSRRRWLRPLWQQLLSGVAGLAALYLVGLPYFYIMMDGALTFGQAAVSCCLIFLPFDGLKLVCTVLLSLRLLPALRRELKR